MRKLHTGHGLNNLTASERAPYGDTLAAQLEEVALALCLMWVNRLLFLKLLEGQLVRYYAPEHAARFRFLHPAKLTDYDEVLTLFFEVLNCAPANRSPAVQAAITALVTGILAAKAADPAADTRAAEAAVDAAVAVLYGVALSGPAVGALLAG